MKLKKDALVRRFKRFKIGVSLLFVQLIGFPAPWLGGKLWKYLREAVGVYAHYTN